jgi:hypothetical protein
MENIFGNQQNTGFVSFDEIENAFKTPTQNQGYYEPKPDPAPGNENLGRLADPDGTAFNDPDPIPVEAETVVDREHAMRTGERIARLIDTGIDFTLSNFVARNGESYRADERDLQDIAEAWGEVSEEHNWNIGPEWTLIILYAMVYGPLVKQALTDRRLAMVEAEQKEMKDRQQQLEDRLNQFEDKQNGKPRTIHIDPDYKPPRSSAFTYQPAAQDQAKD